MCADRSALAPHPILWLFVSLGFEIPNISSCYSARIAVAQPCTTAAGTPVTVATPANVGTGPNTCTNANNKTGKIWGITYIILAIAYISFVDEFYDKTEFRFELNVIQIFVQFEEFDNQTSQHSTNSHIKLVPQHSSSLTSTTPPDLSWETEAANLDVRLFTSSSEDFL